MENNSGHVTTVRADKTLLADVPCLCIGCILRKGRQYTDRRVIFYPDEVSTFEIVGVEEGEESRKKIFFVPAIPYSLNTSKAERVLIPIFMLNLKPHYRNEIIAYGRLNGFEINESDFEKIQIAGTANDALLEFEEQVN